MAVKPVPEGYHTITPYLSVKDARGFMDFVIKALGAEEIYTSHTEDGNVMHAEIKIGDSMMMISEAGEKNPATNGNFYLYVTDTDAAYKKAVDAGAVSLMEPADQFYGDRTAGVRDSFGYNWWFGTHVEDVSPEEMDRRVEENKKKN
ncbi:MAG: VOC family protein [Ignavibacteria bacterium]|nr:VOC family protein [Ignavibacteria bacterium]